MLLASRGISNYLLKGNAKLRRLRQEGRECTVKLDALKPTKTLSTRQMDMEEEKTYDKDFM